ncbi:unnamed protein product [Lactuca saligna]|uniref:Uncharacterized protein n=1 Tax=Lactuca saligna TaxID=75948 RepID=A0AA35YEL5_LACSI|nr:unnamed protein product [Lactuca saligna]
MQSPRKLDLSRKSRPLGNTSRLSELLVNHSISEISSTLRRWKTWLAKTDDDGPAQDEGDLSEEEPTPLTPPDSPSRSYYQPYLLHGKGPCMMRTPRTTISPKDPKNYYISYLPLGPSCSDLLSSRDATDLPPLFEVGESSRAPLRFNPEDDPIPRLMTQTDQTEDRIRSLEQFMRGPGFTSLDHRVETLMEEEKENYDAIQILYHLSGADHDAVNVLSAQVRA